MGTVPVEENEPERSKEEAVKPQGEERRINVKIEEVVEASPDKSLPIIGYFPSGYDPAEKQPSVRVLRGVKRKRRVKVAVKPSESSSNVTFVGTNYSGVPQMCSYRLGVLDKSTNKLTLLPIESDKIFRLEPKFGVHDPTTDLEGENDIPAAAAAVEDHQPNFNFSTKKSEQSAKKQMALRAHRDSEAVDDLNSKMAEAKINSKALEEVCAQASSGGRNVPPYDLSATAPYEAYPLEKIIGHLSDVGELLQQGKYIKSEAYPLFVCNRIHKIQEVKGDELKEMDLPRIFSYINHLIKFNDKKSKDGPSSEDQHYYKLPRILSHKFNDMFANTESRWLAGDKKDLLIRYVLVLTLFADDFKTDFSDIARDLRMTAGELRPHFESLGCKFVKENKLTLATLPVPLLFPTGVKWKKRRG